MRTEAPNALTTEPDIAPDGTTPTAPWARWAVLAMAVVAFAVAIIVHRWLFPLMSGDHDEPVYRFQARMLLHGQLNVPKSQAYFFRPWLSGRYNGRVVMAFTPGWPALLAASQAVFRSMIVAVGLAASGAIVAAYLFAREALDDDTSAVATAAIVLASPFFVILSATYLNYTVAIALEFFFAWALLRALRTGSRVLLLVAGALAGYTFLTRPFDVFLFGAPLALYTAYVLRGRLKELATTVAWVAVGATPFVVAMLLYNLGTSGRLLTFPTPAQSNNLSRFFFGRRAIATDTPTRNYTFELAWTSLKQNVHPLWTWIAGTLITLVAAVYGFVRLVRRRAPRAVLLLGLIVVFPVGYLFWWASSLTTIGARNGLGPHYYLPLLPALATLSGYGLVQAWRRWRVVTAVAVALGLALTVVAAHPKFDEKVQGVRGDRHYRNQVAAAADRLGSGKRIVVLERRNAPYIMEPYPFLGNDPRLRNKVLYSNFRGADLLDLVDRYPGRRVGRIVRQFGAGGLKDVEFKMEPLRFVSGDNLIARLKVPSVKSRYVLLYASANGATLWHIVDTKQTKVTAPLFADVELTPTSMRFVGDTDTVRTPRRGTLAIGMIGGNHIPHRNLSRAEHRYDFRVTQRDGHPSLDLLLADEQWVRFSAVENWLPLDVNGSVAVSWRVAQQS